MFINWSIFHRMTINSLISHWNHFGSVSVFFDISLLIYHCCFNFSSKCIIACMRPTQTATTTNTSKQKTINKCYWACAHVCSLKMPPIHSMAEKEPFRAWTLISFTTARHSFVSDFDFLIDSCAFRIQTKLTLFFFIQQSPQLQHFCVLCVKRKINYFWCDKTIQINLFFLIFGKKFL